MATVSQGSHRSRGSVNANNARCIAAFVIAAFVFPGFGSQPQLAAAVDFERAHEVSLWPHIERACVTIFNLNHAATGRTGQQFIVDDGETGQRQLARSIRISALQKLVEKLFGLDACVRRLATDDAFDFRS